MTLLSKDAILAAADLVTEEVPVPEWGGSVLVRGLTGQQRDDFESSMLIQAGGQLGRDLRNTRAKLAAKCMVDGDGKRLFADSDVAALGEKSAAALMRVFDVASRLSGLTEEDVAGRERDFPGPAGSGSSTGSPNGSAAVSPAS
jgi:hypothetical protein